MPISGNLISSPEPGRPIELSEPRSRANAGAIALLGICMSLLFASSSFAQEWPPEKPIFNRYGAHPSGDLLLGKDGNLYGTTTAGGEYAEGTLFRITPAGRLTIVQSCGPLLCSSPHLLAQRGGRLYLLGPGGRGGWTLRVFGSALGSYSDRHLDLEPASTGWTGWTLGADGSVFGVLNDTHNESVFKWSLSGTSETLQSFSRPTGIGVRSLVTGPKGELFGITEFGGQGTTVDSNGTVFKISPTGVFTTLHSFSGDDGDRPQQGLLVGQDGNIYGTTTGGGGNGTCDFPTITVVKGCGTVFKVSPSGMVSTLYALGDPGDNKVLLAVDRHGTVYGDVHRIAANGRSLLKTDLFKIDQAGTFTLAHTFTDNFGAEVLTPTADGNVYGLSVGCCGHGEIFKITAAGDFIVLHDFTGADGDGPNRLLEGRDGSLYGETTRGGSGNGGTVFRISPSGTLTTLFEFSEDNDEQIEQRDRR
jgi:uncharacterized repeat protein (TIGR03803 family)